MAKLKLTFSCSNLDRARPLIDGTVEPDGIDLNTIVLMPPERHDRMTRNLDFDACEYSVATYLPAKERGLPITAIPVFPHRQFRQESIFIRERPDLQKPKDLEGQRIGTSHFTNSTGVWARGILSEEYGVDFSGCTWVTERQDEIPNWEPPPGVNVERQPKGGTLLPAFEKGDFDVLIYPPVPSPVAQKKPGFRRLFPNYQDDEIAYFRRTKIFPIMHCIVIKDEILDRYPWVALSLAKAWAEARRIVHNHLSRQQSPSLIWHHHRWAEQQEVFGDFWAYGLNTNRHVLEKEIDYCLQQGLLTKRLTVDSLFAPSTLDWEEESRL